MNLYATNIDVRAYDTRNTRLVTQWRVHPSDTSSSMNFILTIRKVQMSKDYIAY